MVSETKHTTAFYMHAWIRIILHYFLIASADDPPADIPPESFPYPAFNEIGGKVLPPPEYVASLDCDLVSDTDEPSADVLQTVTENDSLTWHDGLCVFPIALE